MLSYAIANTSSPEWFYLIELNLQCGLVKRAHDQLTAYAKVELKKPSKDICFNPEEATEIIGSCLCFLSGAGVISKILFPASSRNDVQRRAAALRKLLEINDLPCLSSTNVRNAFEHIDERLDRAINDYPNMEICPIHISRESPTFPIVLRQFEPATMTIRFFETVMDLALCKAEIDLLKKAVHKAMNRPPHMRKSLYRYLD